MKRIVFLFFIGMFWQVNVKAYRVFPTIAQDLRMLDKNNFPFIAENADGFNLQHDSFTPFSEAQVAAIFNQFKNKKVINHGTFRGQDITKMNTNEKIPNFDYLAAMMLYHEVPALSIDDWKQALSQNTPFPLITHCRSFGTETQYDKKRQEILISSGIMYEFQVTKPDKYDDAVELIKFCVDNKRIVAFLTTFQQTSGIYITAYKEFFYYLKENLDPKYLDSDYIIFIPNTYEDTQVFPETSGFGSTFGVAHWLIDQKSKVYDGYLQPKINFTNLKQNQYFENHSNIQVDVSVNSTALRRMELFINDTLVGVDSIAPYSWSGGLLSDLITGYKELKAVSVENDGTTTEKVIQIEILQDAPIVPGYFNASRVHQYQLRNIPLPEGFIRHVYAGEWIDYKVDVKHQGLYDVVVNLRVQRSKQYGGAIIIKKGDTELGRFTTVLNYPDQPPLPDFVEEPDAVIKNIHLEKGVQTLRVTFSRETLIKPQFYLYGFNFIKHGAPDIEVTEPVEIASAYYGSYAAPVDLKFSAEVKSSRNEGKITSVSLYIDGDLISSKKQPPYEWNKNTIELALCDISEGKYKAKIAATDEKGYYSVKSFDLNVYRRKPFNPNLKIPGIIDAYEFDIGGEGIGYHEEKGGNERGFQGDKSPRFYKTGENEDIEIEKAGGDYVVSAVRDGEWLNYTISDVQAATYDISVNIAANADKFAKVHVYLQNNLLGVIDTKTTSPDGFNVYKDFTLKGVQIKDSLKNAQLLLVMTGDNPNHLFYIKKIKFTKSDIQTKIPALDFDSNVCIYPIPAKTHFTIDLKKIPQADILIYDISGKLIYENYGATNKIIISKNLLNGASSYIIKIKTKNKGIITKKVLMN